MLKLLGDGDWVGITGRAARPGDVAPAAASSMLPRLAGTPIVPLAFATSRHRVLKHLDRFYLALPFGRGLYYGASRSEIAAISTMPGIERARVLIETRMNELAEEADRRVGAAGSLTACAERAVEDASDAAALYRAVTAAATPLVLAGLAWRRHRGKEDRSAFRERTGNASLARPRRPRLGPCRQHRRGDFGC